MKATVEKIDQNQVALEIEVDVQRFESAMEKAYKKVAAKVQVPGFRKGKVPRRVLELRYGKETLYDEALEIIVPEAYFEAIKETEVEPVDQPKIDVIQLEDGQPLIFKATVVVKPEVTLGEYKGIEFEAKPVEVRDEDVERQLETLQKRHAKLTLLTEDAEAQKGDTVIIDFEGFREGVPFEGGKGTDYTLELGGNTFIPGFEDGLIGAKIGEERSLNLTFPEEYHAQELAGKEVVFKTVVKEIKRKEHAPLDDEFAKDVSDFDTLTELKEDIRKNLHASAEQASEQYKRNIVLDKVLENAEVAIPPVMINNQADYLLQDYGRRLEYQGLSLDKFLQMTGQNMAELRANFLPDAEKSVKRELVLEAIAKVENIQVSDEELDGEIAKMAEMYRQPAESMRKLLESRGNIENLRDGILAEKTVKFLVDQAKEIAG